jgi:SEC-C motif-containing protein
MVNVEVLNMAMCSCGSKISFEACCGPILDGSPAPTAEALMRSRYSAFVHRKLAHIERTNAPEIAGDFNRAEAERLAEECEWHSLNILKATENGDTAQVEFAIKFKQDGQEMAQAELASFRRENGLWLYESGQLNVQQNQRLVTKVGRNDPCPCGSGKKAKKCCGTTIELE